jgi:hypothetical protein
MNDYRMIGAAGFGVGDDVGLGNPCRIATAKEALPQSHSPVEHVVQQPPYPSS